MIIIDIITAIISAIAIGISILAYRESINARKRNEKERELLRELDMSNQAMDLLYFDSQYMEPAAESFNKLLAVQTILKKNLLCLDADKLNKYSVEFEILYNDYEKISGKRLGRENNDLSISIALYDINDFPPRLDELYEDLKKETMNRQRDLNNALMRMK